MNLDSIHLLNDNEKRCVNYNFGNVAVAPATGSICGYKFNDLNGNGTWDKGEPGLAGWTINLGGTRSTRARRQAPMGPTVSRSPPPGSYTVRETQQSGWRQTFPGGDGSHSIRLLNANELRCVSYNFGNVAVAQATGSICGYKFNDPNGNGTWDTGESGLAGWTINLVGRRRREHDDDAMGLTVSRVCLQGTTLSRKLNSQDGVKPFQMEMGPTPSVS